jgi:hypothetical protein
VRLAWDHDLCRAVVAVYVRAVLGFLRRRARRDGVTDGRGGAVAIIQRFGGALNLNVHFHALVIDGVFAEDGDRVRFHVARRVTRDEVAEGCGGGRAPNRTPAAAAARGVWPLGPYSRFGWHHPGPLYFYLLAPLYAAGGFRFVGINVSAAIINLTSLTIALTVIRCCASRSLVNWVPIVLGSYILSLTPEMTRILANGDQTVAAKFSKLISGFWSRVETRA